MGQSAKKRDRPPLEQILDLLNKHHQRATYGAVAGVLERPARSLMQGRQRSPRNSWIVSADSLIPTGYGSEEMHSHLTSSAEVIRTAEELSNWMQARTGEVRPEYPAQASIAGADGCKAGWLCLIMPPDSSRISGFVAPSFSVLVEQLPAGSILAIDIPIGLPKSGSRTCEIETRRYLGPRRNSVFRSPIRPMLAATSHREACDIGRLVDGTGISQQSFHIMAKIREVDLVMRTNAPGCSVRECHPELSYTLWANGPLKHPKKLGPGRAERAGLIDAMWPGARESVRSSLPRGSYAPDDLHDAFAALWTADRIRQGRALVLPAFSERDDHGLTMEIVA